MYLYNNGYDKRFGSLSVGLLSNVLSLKESIQSGKKTYDFLKGAEVYKKRLGGQPIQLYRCLIDLSWNQFGDRLDGLDGLDGLDS